MRKNVFNRALAKSIQQKTEAHSSYMTSREAKSVLSTTLYNKNRPERLKLLKSLDAVIEHHDRQFRPATSSTKATMMSVKGSIFQQKAEGGHDRQVESKTQQKRQVESKG